MGFSPLSCWPQNWAMLLGQSELSSPQLWPVTQRKHTFLGEEWHTDHCLCPTDHGVYSLMTVVYFPQRLWLIPWWQFCPPRWPWCVPWRPWCVPHWLCVFLDDNGVFSSDHGVFPTTRGKHLQKRMEASHRISREGAFLLLLSLLW